MLIMQKAAQARFVWWLKVAWTLLKTPGAQNWKGLAASVFGFSLSFAVLFSALSAMSGFERTLKKAVIENLGAIQILHRSKNPDAWEVLDQSVREADPRVLATTPFVYVEGVAVSKGLVKGILIQGLDAVRSGQALALKNRLISGDVWSQKADEGHSEEVLIGKVLAEDLKVKVGDSLTLVVPITDPETSEFERQGKRMKVRGIIDLGKYEWNQRFVLAHLPVAQQLGRLGLRYSGLIAAVDDPDKIDEIGWNLNAALGATYWVRDWKQTNEKLFEAVKIQRSVLFFVLLIIMLVAAFNVAASLVIGVLRRTSDFCLLRAIGLSKQKVTKLVLVQGVLMSGLAMVSGTLLGGAFNYLFLWVQQKFNLLPGSVYKMDLIIPWIRWQDYLSLLVATVSIGLISTVLAIRKARTLNIVEGLRYE